MLGAGVGSADSVGVTGAGEEGNGTADDSTVVATAAVVACIGAVDGVGGVGVNTVVAALMEMLPTPELALLVTLIAETMIKTQYRGCCCLEREGGKTNLKVPSRSASKGAS